jgi:hypothetical protein
MNTSTEAIKTLQNASESARNAVNIIDNLIADHDYQDVASLVANAAAAFLEAATYLMQSKDEDAFEALERGEDYMDEVYKIIDADTDDEE